MQSQETLTLVCFVEVTRSNLSRGITISALPELIDSAIVALAPNALNPTKFYLVEGDVEEVHHAVNDSSVPYHKYAVEGCGDVCKLPDCAEHRGIAPVIPLFRA